MSNFSLRQVLEMVVSSSTWDIKEGGTGWVEFFDEAVNKDLNNYAMAGFLRRNGVLNQYKPTDKAFEYLKGFSDSTTFVAHFKMPRHD